MAFVKVCSLDEVGPGGMAGFYVDEVEVLIVRDRDGVVRAFDGICPHQDSLLAEGMFDGGTIICGAHGWMFNAVTGQGISPSSCRLAPYAVKVEGDEVLVDTEAAPA